MASDFVVDPSIVLNAIGREDAVGIAARKRLTDSVTHAPAHIDAEVGRVLRRAERRGEIDDELARTALAALGTLIDIRYPCEGELARRAWELRHTLGFRDALYVALAETLRVPLLTADPLFAPPPGLSCRVEILS